MFSSTKQYEQVELVEYISQHRKNENTNARDQQYKNRRSDFGG
jgi:hypothetical protein